MRDEDGGDLHSVVFEDVDRVHGCRREPKISSSIPSGPRKSIFHASRLGTASSRLNDFQLMRIDKVSITDS